MKRTVTLTNGEIEFIMNYMNGDSYCFKKTNNKVIGTVSWAMFTNRKALTEAATRIDEFRTEINNGYINDEKSYVTKDDEGNDVRRVKTEYFDEYQKEIDELAAQRTDVTVTTISVKDLEDCVMDDLDYSMMAFLIEENEDYIGPDHQKGEPEVEVIEG